MTLKDLLRSAFAEIWLHRARSVLSGVSLTIGIAATLYTFAQIEWMRQRLQGYAELVGPGRLEVTKKEGYASKGLSLGLTAEDAEAIRDRWPDLYMVYPLVRAFGMRFVHEKFHNEGLLVVGTTAQWRKRDWVYELRGRFLTDEDVRTAARVCVMVETGGWVKKPFWAKFFPEQALDSLLKRKDLLNKQVRIEDHLFTVVGILKEPPRDKDPRFFHNHWGQSGTALVPVSTYQHALLRSRYREQPRQVEQLQIETGDAANAGIMLRRVSALLQARHRNEPDFEIKDYRERISGILKRVRERAVAILVIGIVAILAGGIGIMNVTLATVFSRIHEIGLRRALGATRRDILLQFISEAVVLSLAGGAAGVPLGLLATRYMPPDPDRIIIPGAGYVAIALLIALGTGLFSSLYPAWQASRFEPTEALRYE